MRLEITARDSGEKQEILEVLRENFGDFPVQPTNGELKFWVFLPDDSMNQVESLLRQITLNKKTAPDYG